MNTNFKGFIKSTTKTATAIFLAFVGIGLVAAIGTWGVSLYQAKQAQPYEELRSWDVDLTENLKLTLKARTKVVASRLLTAVQFIGYPQYLSNPLNKNGSLTLHFLDKDGFKIHSKEIKISDFSSIVGPDGKKTGLNSQFEDYIDMETYKRFTQLTVEWILDTEAPKEPTGREDPTVLDHCAPNLSKSERLKRLAQYGTVRETGNDSYSAGTRSLHFFYDGSLLNCR